MCAVVICTYLTGSVTITTEIIKKIGVITLSRMNFSGHVAHVTMFS